jgi:hypothetical protein
LVADFSFGPEANNREDMIAQFKVESLPGRPQNPFFQLRLLALDKLLETAAELQTQVLSHGR